MLQVRVEKVTKNSYQIVFLRDGQLLFSRDGGSNETVAKAIINYEYGRRVWRKDPEKDVWITEITD